MLDFNDVPSGQERKAAEGGTDTAREKDEIRSALNVRIPAHLDTYPEKRRLHRHCGLGVCSDQCACVCGLPLGLQTQQPHSKCTRQATKAWELSELADLLKLEKLTLKALYWMKQQFVI